MATTVMYTAEDVERLPEDERFELIRGERREVSPTGGQHGHVQTRLARFIDAYSDERKLGVVYTEAGFLLSRRPDTLLALDAAFVRAERVLPDADQDGFLPQVPDLVVEIVSPGDSHTEVVEKVMTYLEAGVPLVWEVDPKRKRVIIWQGDHTVHELKQGDTLDGGNVLPGFQVAVADLFPTG